VVLRTGPRFLPLSTERKAKKGGRSRKSEGREGGGQGEKVSCGRQRQKQRQRQRQRAKGKRQKARKAEDGRRRTEGKEGEKVES